MESLVLKTASFETAVVKNPRVVKVETVTTFSYVQSDQLNRSMMFFEHLLERSPG